MYSADFSLKQSPAAREGDVMWRLPAREGSDTDRYFLIEFQSETDPWMAVRTQVYQGLLWQQVIDEQKLPAGARLPPLLSLVLYNGESRWKAPTTTGELIAISPDSAPWPWQPQARYYLLEMGSVPEAELARHAGYERLRGVFSELIGKALAGRELTVSGFDSLLEVQSMLSIRLDEWKQQFIAAGKAEGIAEGEARGKVEGKAEALMSLLTERFGAVAPSWEARIRGATLTTLEAWIKRAIVAPDLPSVFNPSLQMQPAHI